MLDEATPYAIRNMTGVPFKVYTLFDKSKSYFIKDGELQRIAVNYERQTQENISSENQNDEVKIVFTEAGNIPIESILLNKNHKDEHKQNDEGEAEDIIYYAVEVENMQKVLTL